MRLIRQQDYETKAWKNGQGSTREIHCADVAGVLAWRLSLASVQADGPFSTFDGYERILTVVQGAGMRLASEEHTYLADPCQPVRFSGALPIVGSCQNGPVENFNLIFDPSRINADVQLLDAAGLRVLDQTECTSVACYLLQGQLSCEEGEEMATGDTLLSQGRAQLKSASEDLRCLFVMLKHR